MPTPPNAPAFHRLLTESPADWSVYALDCEGYVLGTLEAALWCNWHQDNFRDITLAAVNLGGDTDTTACIAGGLAGLRFGDANIPSDWIAALPLSAEVNTLIEQFISEANAASHS